MVNGNKISTSFYDATLQGGIVHKNEEYALGKEEILSRQLHLRTGVNLHFKNLFLRYMMLYNSRNFIQSKIHRYGSFSIGFSF